MLLRAEIDIRRGALALTANDEVNYLFIQKVKEEVKEIELYAALQPPAETLNARMFHQQGAGNCSSPDGGRGAVELPLCRQTGSPAVPSVRPRLPPTGPGAGSIA